MTASIGYVGIAALAVIVFLIRRFTFIEMAPREPPLLKPRIPLIGHILGLITHESDYFAILQSRTNAPVVTLPMLNKKNYIIFSPHLAQQGFKHHNLDFDLIGLAFARQIASISDQAMVERVKKGPDSYTTETLAAIKKGLTGRELHGMNAAMLSYVAGQLNAISDVNLRVPNLWLWMRDIMSMATVEAFYGHANPFRNDMTFLENLWGFDNGLPAMLYGSPLKARAGARHRDGLVEKLRPYFEKRFDKNADVSFFVKYRTEASLKYGVLGDDLCRAEAIHIWVSTANSIPALFWTLVNVWQRPSLVRQIYEELFPLVTFTTEHGKNKTTLDIRLIEKRCPLLLSCQREGVRFANHAVTRRSINDDTLLTDEDGTTYLLKRGTDVMWSSIVAHGMPDVWGADASSFNPVRFLHEEDKDTERRRRAAYTPFGGGGHLCPGRNFAYAEILGLIGALVLGYEIEGLQAEKIKMGPRVMAAAIPQPTKDGSGGPITIRRKPGWEDVEWSFAC